MPLCLSGLLLAQASRSAGGEPGASNHRVPGLSDREIIGLLLPGYVEPPPRSQDPYAEPEWNVTRACISESLVSDFGLGAGSFVLVALNGTTGGCAQCGFTVVGLLDPGSRSVVWRLEPEGYGGHDLKTLGCPREIHASHSLLDMTQGLVSTTLTSGRRSIGLVDWNAAASDVNSSGQTSFPLEQDWVRGA